MWKWTSSVPGWPVPRRSVRTRYGRRGVKTSEDALRQNAGTLFSEINCKQIANGTGEKCGGPAGHEIGEENREISGKLNALRPCRGGERISVLVNMEEMRRKIFYNIMMFTL